MAKGFSKTLEVLKYGKVDGLLEVRAFGDYLV
jgi:hypothetical protein